jgi:hypothetical protein
MADDIGARVSAALHAYADLVEDRDPRTLPSVPAAVPAARRWLVPALVAAAAIVIVGGGGWLFVGTGHERASVASAPESRTAPEAPPRASADGRGGPGVAGAAPGGPAQPAVGVPQPYELYTHCGVLGTDIDGIWFAADPPLVEDFSPPEGWGNPYQAGTLTLQTPAEAVFRDDAGHEVRFVAAPESSRPPPCA